MRLSVLLAISIFTILSSSYAQQKNIAAVRAANSFKIDGNLDETDWLTAPVATDFITNSPVFGTPSDKKSIVKIL